LTGLIVVLIPLNTSVDGREEGQDPDAIEDEEKHQRL